MEMASSAVIIAQVSTAVLCLTAAQLPSHTPRVVEMMNAASPSVIVTGKVCASNSDTVRLRYFVESWRSPSSRPLKCPVAFFLTPR